MLQRTSNTSADAVADKSSAVNQKLLKRRQHIEELNRVQNLLNKLQVSTAYHSGTEQKLR